MPHIVIIIVRINPKTERPAYLTPILGCPAHAVLHGVTSSCPVLGSECCPVRTSVPVASELKPLILFSLYVSTNGSQLLRNLFPKADIETKTYIEMLSLPLWKRGGVNTLPSEKRSRFSIRWNGEKLPTVGKIRTVWCPTPPLTHALPQTGSEHMSMAQRAISSQTPVLHHESGTIESGREECGCQSPTAEIWILGLPVPGCRQLTSYSSFWTLVTSSEIENNSTIYLTGKNRWDNLWNMLNVLSGT